VLSNRTFSLALAITALVVMLLIVGFALYLVPMSGMISTNSGDLTRIGWYPNNRYGNQKPNLVFQPSLVTQADAIDRHYDVMVVGDSFSLDLEKSWPNYLAANGLSVLVIGVAGDFAKPAVAADVERQITTLVQSQAFRDTPPSVFVFESIERLLKKRLVNDAKICTPLKGSDESTALAEPPVVTYRPPKEYLIKEVGMPPAGSYSEQQLTYARDFLVKNIRKVFGWKSDVVELSLRVPRFSSELPNTLLVTISDLDKEQWQDKDIHEMQCQLLRLQHAVQSNGKTLFIALPIPDKLSAYHDDLVDQSPPPGGIERLTDLRLNRPRIEKAIRSAIASGEKDVYLPNDTHFGSQGQLVTANTVLKFIDERTRRVVAPRTTPAPPKSVIEPAQ
jgi:hypothetical protein